MGYSISTMVAVWCLLLFGISVVAVRVHGQTNNSTMGFISLDCSIADGSSCTDDTTNIPTSDDQFISAGTKHIIPMQYVTASTKKQLSLRSFPNGTRNCYTLKSTVVGNFISIDCGIPDGSSYADDGTNITYTSDAQFIAAGVNHNISADHVTTSLPRQQSSLRSFPNGPRNCYTLKPVKQGQKYLIRAFFLHGNYDGCCKSNANVSFQFDLHLGVNLWKAVNISNTSFVYGTETMTIASADFILICLINKGHGIPFISSLELRPLKSTLYPAVNPTCSLVLYARRNFGKKYGTILRYPDDQKDRIWIPFRNDPFWSDISTTNEVDHPEDDPFEVPRAVLQTAAVPVNSNKLAFYWRAGSSDETRLTYHYFMHFAEIQDENRTFNINLNGEFWYGPVTPPDRMSLTVYTISPGNLYWYNISLLATEYSIGPPSINAIEVYWVMLISANETNVQDVKAIMAIKEQYKVKRNWMGDPCAPSDYAWDGLHCSSSTNSDKPRIISLNLSSSGLTGDIIRDFAELKVIENLDLSYNNLTGSIPDFLEELLSLKVLNLTGNKFSGSIPSALLKRNSTGSLILRVEVVGLTTCDIENLCEIEKKKKKNITVPILAVAILVLLGLLLVVVFIVCRMRRRQQGLVLGTTVRLQNENYFLQQVYHGDRPLQAENRRFTYTELQKITNNFNHIIGKGGFGNVFHGYLENETQVAVKTRSQSSSQGTKEFLAEAKLLTRVHHRNLVSLVGYCEEGNYLALVYEYMSQGSLQDHLRGKPANIGVLSWRKRLQIALESAQGLEYLHAGCRPTIVHRDVKSSNILLNHNLEAKIADFGLSKAFQSDVHSHISTVGGTPGYLDPEYYQTYQLNEKSDVYGFGVVLLELITGQPPLLPTPGEGHIVQRVRAEVARGNIDDIVDARLQGEYDVNSVWKAVNIALMCTALSSVQRATMDDVVMQLKECLALQIAWNQHHYTEAVETSLNSAFEIADVGKVSVVGGPSAG